jgi:UDP-glucose 4-epimerase
MKNKLLITGSSGMVGTALCEELLKRKIDFVGIDKINNKWNKEIDKKTIRMDLLNKPQVELLKKKFARFNFTMIIHLAANARVWDLILDSSKAIENVEMTNNIYEFAKNCNIKKLIVASSREVYGEELQSPIKKLKEEDVKISNCSNQYAASKMFLEALAKANKIINNIDSIILRFSNIYGMYDKSDRFIPLLIQKMLQNNTVQIYGGKQKAMDFTYILDAVQGIFTAINKFDKMKISDKNDGTYNISTGRATSLYDISKMVKKELKSNSKVGLIKNRLGEPMYYTANVSKIKKFGYLPIFPIEIGIRNSINYYKEIFLNY